SPPRSIHPSHIAWALPSARPRGGVAQKPRGPSQHVPPPARTLSDAEPEVRLPGLPNDVPIAAYCRGPRRVMGVRGADTLRRSGRDVTRLTFSVGEWRAAGRSLETL